MNKIQILKTRSVTTPTRANKSDSGIDFFVPDDLLHVNETPSALKDWKKLIYVENNEIIIKPWKWVLIPSWIKMIIQEGYDLVFENKSWISTKYWLVIWAKVVDSSYRWEVHLHLINTSRENVIVKSWQKIAQWIIRKVENDFPIEISEEKFEKQSNTSRWQWGFWSTWE